MTTESKSMDKIEQTYLQGLRRQLEETQARARELEGQLAELEGAAESAMQRVTDFRAAHRGDTFGSPVASAVFEGKALEQLHDLETAQRAAIAKRDEAATELSRCRETISTLQPQVDAPTELAHARAALQELRTKRKEVEERLQAESALVDSIRARVVDVERSLGEQEVKAREQFARGASVEGIASGIATKAMELRITRDLANDAAADGERRMEALRQELEDLPHALAAARKRVASAEAAAAALSVRARLAPIMPLVARALAAAQATGEAGQQDPGSYRIEVPADLLHSAAAELEAASA